MTNPASLTDITQLSAYDYALPDELVARYPLERRDDSRLMVINRATGEIRHQQFNALGDYLTSGDCLVMNNTRVLPNRLMGHREGFTGQVEVFLLYPDPSDDTVWTALMRPTRKLQPGTRIVFDQSSAVMEVLDLPQGTHGRVRCHLNGLASVAALMQQVGKMPIPPYLGRPAEDSDKTRYQTVYAQQPGSHAAPTAGLHFTPELLLQLEQQGVDRAELTLNVSTGTFRSVNTATISQHKMDAEHYTLPDTVVAKITRCKQQQGRVFAVGTTSVKTLETAYQNQQGQLTQAESGWSQLFVTPGFKFGVADAMITNFHLPKSTLMMMISAFMGHELMHRAYALAIAEKYRFYSYGDAMLIL